MIITVVMSCGIKSSKNVARRRKEIVGGKIRKKETTRKT
jgi:hypothetical protein